MASSRIHPHPRSRRPLLAAVVIAALVALSGLHLTVAARDDAGHNPVAALSAILGLVGLIVAFRYLTARCFESRLLILLIGGGTMVLVWLVHTIGAPGAAPESWHPRDVVVMALAAGLAASWPATAPTVRGSACSR